MLFTAPPGLLLPVGRGVDPHPVYWGASWQPKGNV